MEQRKFEKQDLNSDDYSGTEKAAKTLKELFGGALLSGLLYSQKEKLIPIVKKAASAVTSAAKMIIK